MEGLEEPENYPEALSNASYAFKPPNEIPDDVQQVLEMSENPPTKDQFWVYVAALKQFITEKGRTPVSGVIPDFHSDTKSYVKIKDLYNKSANRDFEDMLTITSKISGSQLNEEEVKTFCKNWQFLTAIQMRPIEDQINSDWLYDENPEGVGWYFVFRAADVFFSKEGRYPSPADKEQLLALAEQEVKKSGINHEEYKVASKFVEEM